MVNKQIQKRSSSESSQSIGLSRLSEHKKLKLDVSNLTIISHSWIANHVLDDTSPLLKEEVRQKIKEEGGSWPKHLNSARGIRSAFSSFSNIIFYVEGVSNSNATYVSGKFLTTQ